MPSRSSSTSTSEASEPSRQKIILEALGLSDSENEPADTAEHEADHPEPDPAPQPEVCAETQRDVSIASSVTAAEEVTSQRSLRHLNAILTEMAGDTDTKQHSDLGDGRMPDVPGTCDRAEDGFSEVRDLVRDSSGGDVQDTQQPKPNVEQLKDSVGRFFSDDSTEGGSSLVADATMEDPCLWLADKSLDPLLAVLAQVKPLEIGKPYIPRAVLDRAVWELSREHEELLRIADQQAGSVKETFHGWICGSGIEEGSGGRRVVAASASRSRPMERASLRATFRLRCAERITPSELSKDCPVKLVVFDFDETLTLATFMTGNCEYADDEEKDIARVINFETPWVEGSRIVKLQKMLQAIKEGADGRRRFLTVLTNNGKGVQAVINMLKIAGLDSYFSAVWTMPWRQYMPNGAYKDQKGEWKLFDPPSDKVRNHKADVLTHVTKYPDAWFPQVGQDSSFAAIENLQMGNIVLVDDQRANFQSQFGASILRYCKVARYDADLYYDMRMVKNMGGIGAHHDADYDTLKRFVEDPWMCKETLQIRCQERDFRGWETQPPVKLVVFDFDETLTLATFMPQSKAIATKVGWTPAEAAFKDWSQEDLVKYNFDSPWCEGRVQKLKSMFEDIVQEQRVLTILTQNASGVVAVLNLLKLAGLAEHFSAIWSMSPAQSGECDGAFWESGRWHLFQTPCSECHRHKADVLTHVAEHPLRWFPQLGGAESVTSLILSNLHLENIVLVDDERANFRSEASLQAAMVLRYCKVARYDETYRDCGLLDQMGGIGAHSDGDYEELRSFLQKPWDYPYPTRAEMSPMKKNASSGISFSSHGQAESGKAKIELVRCNEDEPEATQKAPRHRIGF
ncbi:Ucp1 [Symbiodinium sp. CCMP2592]|nr:Ucp1 [Symbiodinium sp. CCMP2592]